MNLTILGANGRVGQLVVRRALDRGHRVRAFVHSRDPFEPDPSLEVVAGDITDAAAVSGVVADADAVISTLGTFRRGTTPVLASGLMNVAQTIGGGSRVVVLTGAGVTRPGQRAPVRTRLNRTILTLMDRSAVGDVDQAIAVLAGSDLAWTAVCAPTITASGPADYRLVDRMPSLLAKVTGPAVAASLVDLAETTTAPAVVGIEQAGAR